MSTQTLSSPRMSSEGSKTIQNQQIIHFFRPWYEDRPVHLAIGKDVPAAKLAMRLSVPASSGPPTIVASTIADARRLGASFAGLIILKASAPEVVAEFPGRTVRTFAQSTDFPYRLYEDATGTIVAVGELPIPKWPSVAMVIHASANDCSSSVADHYLAGYPGFLRIVIAADNRTEIAAAKAGSVTVIDGEHLRSVSASYNLGLNELWHDHWYDFFVVGEGRYSPELDTLSEMVVAYHQLANLGHRAGILGPTANPSELQAGNQSANETYLARNHSSAMEVTTLDGQLLLIHSDCFAAIGGFDPKFNTLRYTIEDYCLRARLNNFTLWSTPGAILFSDEQSMVAQSSKELVEAESRNHELFLEKWQSPTVAEVLSTGDSEELLRLPLATTAQLSGQIVQIGDARVDLIFEASTLEFAAFVAQALSGQPRELRLKILDELKVA